jgi:hypothetical protein
MFESNTLTKEEAAVVLQQALEYSEGRSTLGPDELVEMALLFGLNWATIIDVLVDQCEGDIVLAHEKTTHLTKLLRMGSAETNTRQ